MQVNLMQQLGWMYLLGWIKEMQKNMQNLQKWWGDATEGGKHKLQSKHQPVHFTLSDNLQMFFSFLSFQKQDKKSL